LSGHTDTFTQTRPIPQTKTNIQKEVENPAEHAHSVKN